MSKSQLGWVYVLHNPSFKDNMIKIGFTNRPTPQQRAQELSKHTGVPTEFEVVYAVQVPNAQSVETRVHQILQHKRAQNNREFFECSTDEAVKTIRSVAGKSVVKEMDLRGNANRVFRQPENPARKNTRKKTPSSKIQNRGLIFTMMIVLILFFVAMLFVGWNVEQKEKAQSPQTSSAQTVQPEKAAPPAVKPDKATTDKTVAPDDDVQAAWLKIAPEIRETLQEEQQEWERQKQARCAKAQNKMACEQELNAARVRYLRDFSI